MNWAALAVKLLANALRELGFKVRSRKKQIERDRADVDRRISEETSGSDGDHG